MYARLAGEINDLDSYLNKKAETSERFRECVDSLSYLSVNNRATIIFSIVYQYNNNMESNRHIACYELLKILVDRNASIESKWKKLIEYFRNKQNVGKKLYNIIDNAISAKLYEENCEVYRVYADTFLASALANDTRKDYKNAIRYIEDALNILNRIPKKEAKNDRRTLRTKYASKYFMSKCLFELRMYREAIDCLQEALDGYEKFIHCYPQLKDEYANDKNGILELRRRAYSMHVQAESVDETVIRERWQSSAFTHSVNFWMGSATKGAKIGAGPGFIVYEDALKGDCYDTISRRLGGLTLALAGAIPGAIIGSLHGFFRAGTRDSISKQQQDDLQNLLRRFLKLTNEQKDKIVKEIVAGYESEKNLAASISSTNLLQELKSANSTLEEKSEAITEYMNFREGNIYKNNGKKLYRIVFENLTVNILRDLLEKLRLLSDVHKEKVVKEIIDGYKNEKTIGASKVSTNLLQVLTSTDSTLDLGAKINAIIGYMYPKEDVAKNNHRRLYRVIFETLYDNIELAEKMEKDSGFKYASLLL